MSEVPEWVGQTLREAGLAGPGEQLVAEALGGGVSNEVWAARVGDRAMVLKRALPRLRVAAEWLSDVERIHREGACQRWLGRVLAPGEVPAVLHEDPERHILVMERAPAAAVNWKTELLAGRIPATAAARAGSMLGRIHAAGVGDETLRAEFGDLRVFAQLRLDPYLRTIAARHPDLAGPLGDVIDGLSSIAETMVHGDYSPKNILLLPERNILLDHEVAHYGEPRFDLGFFFCHLFLKALHLPALAEPLWAQVDAAWTAYRAERPAAEDWLPHLGCLLLARVDGKSPAEYLTEPEQVVVRRLARPLIEGRVESLAAAVELARRVAC